MAVLRGSLKTITVKGRTQLACGFEAHGDDAFVSFASMDSEMISTEAAAGQLLNLAARGKTKMIRLPLVGKAGLECVQSMERLTRSSSEYDSMNFMVKVL
ncbi:MAG: hypothetical protein C4K49_08000 [Candidatus Thorarchaeota archaeon]|nr:MAG: hypothetical protein C4K49_08000 [Candidatus Thorarchaeota archaeon]